MNVVTKISAVADTCGQAVAVVDNGQEYSYKTLISDVRRFSALLFEIGMETGDRVGIHAAERYETIVAMLGTAHAGGVFVPINRVLKANQVAHIIADCQPKVLVAGAAALGAMLKRLPHLEADTRVILLDPVPADWHWPDGLTTAWNNITTPLSTDAARPADEAPLCAILYTSGSTGQPRGVMLSHENLLAGADSVNQYLGITTSDRTVSALPWSFDAGLSQVTTALTAGASIALHTYLLPRDLLSAVRRDCVTVLSGVPSLWVQLAQSSGKVEPISNVRLFTNTGGSLAVTTRQKIEQLLPKADCYLMYGFTEAFRGTYLPPGAPCIDQASVLGKPIPNATIHVLDEAGNTVAPGTPGELVQSGPHVTLGYWNNPVATARKFRPLPAHLHNESSEVRAAWSGDTVYSGPDGYLYFVGRKDALIKTSGYRVSPEEVENTALARAEVRMAVAFSVPDDSLGSAICLVWAPSDANDDTAGSQLREHMRKKLPAYMVPKHYVGVTSIPLNANGKPDRQSVRALYGQSVRD